ncbi:MAG: hypothetical protein ACOZHQ_06055 [Thermodesulfobacteriota bacterium]
MPRKTAWLAGAVLALTAALALGGCANLGHVKNYADQSAQVIGQVKAAEKRSASLIAQERSKLEKQKVDALAGAVGSDEQMERLMAPIELSTAEQTVHEFYQNLESLLAAYFTAIGKLAGDETLTKDHPFNLLLAQAQGLPMLTGHEQERELGQELARRLYSAATNEYRRGQLEQFMADNQATVDILLGSLQKFLTDNYAFQMKQEAGRLREQLAARGMQAGDFEFCRVWGRGFKLDDDEQRRASQRRRQLTDACLAQMAVANHQAKLRGWWELILKAESLAQRRQCASDSAQVLNKIGECHRLALGYLRERGEEQAKALAGCCRKIKTPLSCAQAD